MAIDQKTGCKVIFVEAEVQWKVNHRATNEANAAGGDFE